MNHARRHASHALSFIILVGLAGLGCTAPEQVGPLSDRADQPGTDDTPRMPGIGGDRPSLSGSTDRPETGLPGDPDGPGGGEDAACGEATAVTLIAGKTGDAGTVTIENDAAALCVYYAVKQGWAMRQTHTNVTLTAPESNQPPGSFLDVKVHDPAVTSYTVCFSLAAFGYEPGTEVFVAAHADLTREIDGVEAQHESGWAGGEPSAGSNWAEYVTYTIQPCTP